MFEQHAYQYFEDVNWGLLRLWGARSGRDVLDAGCGFATTSQYIQRRANRVVGIEASGDAVVVARQRIQQVIQADLTNVGEWIPLSQLIGERSARSLRSEVSNGK